MEKTYNNITSFSIINFLEEVDTNIKSKVTACVHKGTDLTVYLNTTLDAQETTDLDDFVSNHDATPAPAYRIISLVNDEFKGYSLENIDFARHLDKNIALNKKVTKSNDGRPDLSKYYNGDDLIAEIDFVFETDSDNLLTKRQEFLYYYKEDDTKSEALLIKEKIYDMTDLVDGERVVDEREASRKAIVSSMKAFLAGVLKLALSKSLPEVIVIIKPFWDEYSEDRKDFIELGDESWKNNLAALDLGTTPHTWLAADIGGGVTVRDYLVSRLSY